MREEQREAAPCASYAFERLRHLLRPPVTITPPPPEVFRERDVEVPMRDGTVLRVNVHRPRQGGRHPVIICAHPYGKDNLPRRASGGRYSLPRYYRIMHISEPVRHSALASWEAPDPAFWVPRGYVVVNADLRGFGRSDGEGTLFTRQEHDDYHDIIEWAAAQPWSTGRVGLNGVSYLALSQWGAAATRPPHLCAICPWEGFSDLYRDLACPGGIEERGFFAIWSRGVRAGGRISLDLLGEQARHPERDDWWAEHTPRLDDIEVPMLVCGSFSDHTLHTRGSFRGFARASSKHRWLYTHRGGKWSVYYSREALEAQARFFDWALKDEDNGMADVPPVRLEVRRSRREIHEVRHEAAWPLPSTVFTPLWLRSDGRLDRAPSEAGSALSFDTRNGRLTFTYTFDRDTEITGPMKLRLHVEARGADDLHLFAGVRKFSNGREVTFEGGYGFGLDMVTRGWLKASHRALDLEQTRDWQPVHTHRNRQPLSPGEIVAVDIALLPSSTFFAKGESMSIDVQGRWFYLWNPFLGAFPARYAPSPPATCVAHVGGVHDAHLLVPFIP